MTTRKNKRQVSLFVYSTLLWIVGIVLLGAMFLFYETAKADEAPGANTIGYWYGQFTGDNKEAHANTVIVIANAIDAYAYGKAIDFGSDFKDLDFELIEARRMHTLQCFGDATRENVVTAFFGWNLKIELPPIFRLGAAVALFTETACAINDVAVQKNTREKLKREDS